MAKVSTLDTLWLYLSRMFYPNWLSIQFFTEGWGFFFAEEVKNLALLIAIGQSYDLLRGSLSISGLLYKMVGAICIRKYFAGGVCTSRKSMEGKNVIITGANVGIGKDTARDLLKRGARVIMACRDQAKGEAARRELVEVSSKVELHKLDLSSLASVREFAKVMRDSRIKIHVLINNAGVMQSPYTESKDGFELQMATNHLAHFLLTNLLLPQLRHTEEARIINVSSLAHLRVFIDLNNLLTAEKDYKKAQVYGETKMANVLFTKGLEKRLKGTNILVFALHPGGVDTEIGRHLQGAAVIKKIIAMVILKTPAEGAQTTIYCATDAQQAPNLYFSDCTVGWPNPVAVDGFLAECLWKKSAELVGLKEE